MATTLSFEGLGGLYSSPLVSRQDSNLFGAQYCRFASDLRRRLRQARAGTRPVHIAGESPAHLLLRVWSSVGRATSCLLVALWSLHRAYFADGCRRSSGQDLHNPSHRMSASLTTLREWVRQVIRRRRDARADASLMTRRIVHSRFDTSFQSIASNHLRASYQSSTEYEQRVFFWARPIITLRPGLVCHK